jgi:hypothetical protein
MYFPPPWRLYSDADSSRLDVLYYRKNPLGFIDVAPELKYLGSIAHYSLTSDVDDYKRIRSA